MDIQGASECQVCDAGRFTNIQGASECLLIDSSSSGTSTAKVVEITFPGTLSSLTETQQTQMKDAVKAALPVISGITYSVELRSGSIIAKVTITGTSTAAAAQQVETTVAATPLSIVVNGQTYTSTEVAVVDKSVAS